jgi:hypothetical protein
MPTVPNHQTPRKIEVNHEPRPMPRNRMQHRERVHERRLTKRELRELIDQEAWVEPATTE